MKSGRLNFLEPSGPLQACNGTALPLDAVSATEWYISTNYIDKNGKLMVCSLNERFVPFVIAGWTTSWGVYSKGVLRVLAKDWKATRAHSSCLSRCITSDDYCDLSMEHLQGHFIYSYLDIWWALWYCYWETCVIVPVSYLQEINTFKPSVSRTAVTLYCSNINLRLNTFCRKGP